MDINKFWSDVINQNRTMLYSYFDNDAVIRWHCTNEIFTVDEYIKANCDYPGKWCGKIERIENFVIIKYVRWTNIGQKMEKHPHGEKNYP